jgi:hypothetical protein
MDQDLLPEINSLIQPLESLFSFLEGRGLVVLHGKAVDFKAIVLLDLMKIAVLTAEVHDTVNPLLTYGLQLVIGHGRMTHRELIRHPVQGISSHRLNSCL